MVSALATGKLKSMQPAPKKNPGAVGLAPGGAAALVLRGLMTAAAAAVVQGVIRIIN